jgi:hypothetical protein
MTYNNQVPGEHVTTDLGEAAYLKMLGLPLSFDRSNPRIIFIFKGDEELIKMKAMDYYEYRTKVDAKTYSDTLKSLKKSIMEGKPRNAM